MVTTTVSFSLDTLLIEIAAMEIISDNRLEAYLYFNVYAQYRR